jgi:hypothetical protein
LPGQWECKFFYCPFLFRNCTDSFDSIERAKLARLNDIFAQSSKDFLMSQRGSGKQTGYMATMMGKLERTKRKRVESSAMGSGDRKRVRWEGENSGGSGGSYLLKDGYHSGDFEYGGGY